MRLEGSAVSFSDNLTGNSEHRLTSHSPPIGPARIATYYDGGPEYFGVGPKFIESRMKGRFDKTTVILMGCDA